MGEYTLDAAIDGQLAKKLPESKGKDIIVRVDCYDLPRAEVKDFFAAFSGGALEVDDCKIALKMSEFVNSINFDSTK